MEFAPETEFVVLIADVVRSRDLPTEARTALQSTLRTLIAEWGGRRAWPAAPALTGGDSIQAMCAAPDAAALVDLLVDLTEAVHPVRLAAGVGRGMVTTALDAPIAAVDGPCFHRAREALDHAGERGLWGTAIGFGDSLDRAATAILVLMGTIRGGWTDRQAEMVRAVRAHETQKVAAERLGVARSTISESLKAAHFDALREGEAALAAVLIDGEASR